ncbi:AAA family ATPase [Fortiea contorta]|uniref:AAA family ATPase n=1 Tax=Fortiea contorta TaxID=1892405 RepID=UPI0003459AB6|nr:AAA family ATPase [Fortiea contorta]
MSEEQQLPISIKPIINYPQEAQVDKTYLMTIDLELSGDGEWQYQEEEYPITCMLETLPRSLFSSKPMGEPTLVLHRFGGTYGPAKFLLKAASKEIQGKIKITLVNSWGIELQVLNLAGINVRKTVPGDSKPIGIYKSAASLETSWNPYIVGTPIQEPERFFGRENVFQLIEDYLNLGTRIIVLHGQRRIGKSSVLKMIPIFNRLEDFVFVEFDLADKSKFPLINILHQLATAIVDELSLYELTLPTLEELEDELNTFYLKFLLQVYEQIKDKKLVLLLDEFDVIFSSREPNFLSYLQILLSQQEKLYIIPVIVSFSNIPSIFNLFKSVPRYKIDLLDEISAIRLITKPAEGLLEYSRDAIQTILQISAGHPYFTQIICFIIFRQARYENNLQVTAEDVENIIEPAMEIAEGGLAWMWQGLSITEQIVFAAVAEAQQIAIEQNQESPEEPLKLLEKFGVIPTDSLIQASENLAENDFLDDTKCRVKVEFVRRWSIESHPLKREISNLEILGQEYWKSLRDAANTLHLQGNTARALILYEDILKINPNHFSTVLDLAEGYSRLGNYEKAVEFYARAYQFDSLRNKDEFVRSLLAYGRELITQGKIDQAQEQFTKVLQIEPNNTQVQEYRLQARTEARHSNPFVVGEPVPPDRFFGRINEITTAFEQINNGGNLSIWGGPGMGKSSFLDKLADPRVLQQYLHKSEDAIALRFNCEVVEPFTPAGFWREILLAVAAKLANEPTLQTEIDALITTEPAKRDNLQLALKKLGEHNKFLLLLIDNYDHALRTNEQYTEAQMDAFVKDCRYLANAATERKYLSMVVSSLQRLSELGPKQDPKVSPWFNHYLFLSLKLFSQREVEQILKANIPQIRYSLQEAIAEISGGHPYLVQIAGFMVYRQIINPTHFDKQAFADEFENRTRQIFQSMWNRCSEIEQSLLMLMALSAINGRLHKRMRFDLGGIDLIFNQRDREFTSLKEQGVIIRTENVGKYAFSSSIMERWVMQEIWQSDDPTLKGREKVLLNIMSRQQVKKVTTAMDWLWQHKNQVPSILEWFAKVVSAFEGI